MQGESPTYGEGMHTPRSTRDRIFTPRSLHDEILDLTGRTPRDRQASEPTSHDAVRPLHPTLSANQSRRPTDVEVGCRVSPCAEWEAGL